MAILRLGMVGRLRIGHHVVHRWPNRSAINLMHRHRMRLDSINLRQDFAIRSKPPTRSSFLDGSIGSNVIHNSLLERLRCPISKQPLRLADEAEILACNQAIESGQARDHIDAAVDRTIEGGLISESAGRWYPIREKIPCLVVEESIQWPFAGND